VHLCDVTSWPRFEALWLAMMAAMMAPAAYPMLLVFARVQATTGGATASRLARPFELGAFVAGYLAIWSLLGAPAYFVMMRSEMGGIGLASQGAALLVAGMFQLTPWKEHSLSHCRSPLSFFLHGWREGAVGALSLGARHGLYCVACCWALIAVWAVLGMMNPWWMLAATAVIFAERVLPRGPAIGKALGITMLVAGGTLVLGGRFA